jgi:hypothetical protein
MTLPPQGVDMSARKEVARYWESRQDLLYYQVVRVLAQGLSKEAASILDVGSALCPYLDWFPHIEERVSVDLKHPYDGPGVVPIRADFLEWQPEHVFDVVTCLQVLEHVPRADLFAKKLLSAGRIVVVSVPYKWRDGTMGSHVHDPVDQQKLRSWFGREPNFEYLCKEVGGGSRRLIQVYERDGVKWRNLKDRARKLKRAAKGRPVEKIGPDAAVPPDGAGRQPGGGFFRYRRRLASALKRAAARIDS